MSYQIHISQFDGPLDLLLHLIESAEVDIKDIFISEITTQYLSYMADLDGLDMDTASEFLNMASTLLYIKSRQLLPRPPKEEIEEEDPEVLLLRQLREYQLFKQAGEELFLLEKNGIGSYTRLPEEFLLPDQEIELSGATMQELYRAFFTLLHAQPEEQEQRPFHQVRPDAFTVRIQIGKIRALLSKKNELPFEALFADVSPRRMEVVVTFMAILEMLTRGEVTLHQLKPFSPIRLRVNELGNEFDMDYMDELE